MKIFLLLLLSIPLVFADPIWNGEKYLWPGEGDVCYKNEYIYKDVYVSVHVCGPKNLPVPLTQDSSVLLYCNPNDQSQQMFIDSDASQCTSAGCPGKQVSWPYRYYFKAGQTKLEAACWNKKTSNSGYWAWVSKSIIYDVSLVQPSKICFSGFVHDFSNVPVSGASVRFRWQDYDTTLTDGNGKFTMCDPAAFFQTINSQLQITKEGYKPLYQNNIFLERGKSYSLDFPLEKIEIPSDLPPTPEPEVIPPVTGTPLGFLERFWIWLSNFFERLFGGSASLTAPVYSNENQGGGSS